MWKITNDIEIKSKARYFSDAIDNNKMNIDVINCVNYSCFMNREIYLNSITPSVVDNIEKIIRFWNDVDDANSELTGQRKIIKIYINSTGGSLDAAFTLVDVIKNSRTSVYTINTGVCQKEAFYPYLAGHKRYAYPRSSFYFEKELPQLDLSEGQSNYEDFMKKRATEVKDMILEITKITDNDYESRKGWWLTADKANELRVCNEVLRGKLL